MVICVKINVKYKMIEDANFDDVSLQPGDDREFKNQFVEFLNLCHNRLLNLA